MDLTFHNNSKLYLVEIELSSHDVYGHIGEQILRFGISSEMDKYKIKNLLLNDMRNDQRKNEIISNYFIKSSINNVNELLDKVIFENKPSAIIIIDDFTEELSNVMDQLTMATEIIEAQTYIKGNKKLHRFKPLKDDLLLDISVTKDADLLDIIVVPAREDGFKEEFIKNECWFSVRISAAMLDKIKYVAAYQVAPISAITHIAEVERIEKYKESNKYIIYFKKNTVRKLNKIEMGNNGVAPQAPRYSSYKSITNAKWLKDLW